jgi:GT2 family glycosyltransferase
MSAEVGSPNVQPLVSVIVLNFNGSEHLSVCLTSLKEQTYSPMEILVADNGSTDESESVVAAAAVRWEPLGRNHGFAPGYNLAVDLCDGEILVFANTDTRFAPTFVERVITPLRENDDVFTSEGAMYYWYDQTNFRMAQRIHRISLRRSLFGDYWLPMLDRRWSDLITDVADTTEVSGAGMALNRVKFDELGRFDARLPFGWETTEICWRAWLRGWRSVCVPDAQVFHKVGATARIDAATDLVLRGVVGGRLLFATKHLPVPIALATWTRTIAGAVVHPDARKLRVIADYVRLVPDLVRERKNLYGRRSQVRQHFERMLAVGT